MTKISEPDPIEMSSSEFIGRLRNEYRKEIRREYNRLLFNMDPEKYREMGLNEYLERDTECLEEIVIPAMSREGLLSLAAGTRVEVRIDRHNRDPNIVIMLVSGTRTSIDVFKSKLENIHNKLPGEMQLCGVVRLLDIPRDTEETVVGRNGINIYRIQRRFGVTIRAVDTRTDGPKTLAVSGDGQKVGDACNHILDMVYRHEA